MTRLLEKGKLWRVREDLGRRRRWRRGGGGKLQNQATADFAQTGANFSPCFKIAENCETTNPPDSVKRTSEHCNLPRLNIIQRGVSASQKVFQSVGWYITNFTLQDINVILLLASTKAPTKFGCSFAPHVSLTRSSLVNILWGLRDFS